MPIPRLGGAHAALAVHYSGWRRSRVAARGACAGANAAHRRAPARTRGQFDISDLDRGVPAGAGASGLDHRPQSANSTPAGAPLPLGDIRLISYACARLSGPWRLDRRTVAAGDPYRADRVPGRRRSGRRRPGRQSGAAPVATPRGFSIGLPVRSCEQPADARQQGAPRRRDARAPRLAPDRPGYLTAPAARPAGTASARCRKEPLRSSDELTLR